MSVAATASSAMSAPRSSNAYSTWPETMTFGRDFGGLSGLDDEIPSSHFDDLTWSAALEGQNFLGSASPLPSTQGQQHLAALPWSSPLLRQLQDAASASASESDVTAASVLRRPSYTDTDGGAGSSSSRSSSVDNDTRLDADDHESKGQGEAKPRIQRRQGVTCDQCRSKHIRCVLTPPSNSSADDKADNLGAKRRCTRCVEKGLECTRNHAPPSRRYPRPSRTGKRIEQARLLHGTLSASEAMRAGGTAGSLTALASPGTLSMPHGANMHLEREILAGSVSLRLLTCFFATAHMQMPVVDFHNFSARYNFSQGNFRIMSVMGNGGDETQRIPSARQSAPGLRSTRWPPNSPHGSSTLSTPGTVETLAAAMQAWAALYTDLPIAFGSNASMLGLCQRDKDEDVKCTSQVSLDCSRDPSLNASDARDSTSSESPALVVGANGRLRRPKRKQGVACDTCRLRRLRCDKLERPEGMGCSRCEDKQIVCTDQYIQSKRQKSMMAAASSSTASSFTPTDLPKAESDIISSARYLHAQDLESSSKHGTGPASWHDGVNTYQKAWIDAGPKLPQHHLLGRGRDMLAYGKARQPFIHMMVERALALVIRHNLLHSPSIEAVQALTILSNVLHLLKRDKVSDELTEVVHSHTSMLGLESTDEIDEQDKTAIEQILSSMQRKRIWCCVWTRDALVAGLLRRVPSFEAERAFGIKGANGRAKAMTSNMGGHHSGGNLTSLHTDQHILNVHQSNLTNAVATAATSSLPSPSGSMPELNGEMGLSFSILALMQLGALSRFMSKYIDNIAHVRPAFYMSSGFTSTSRHPPPERFPMMPTPTEMRKLERGSHALWRSIDALMLFFDECILKARRNMESLHPFQPLGWIATIKVASATLDLSTFRILSERLRLARAYMQATAMTAVGTDMQDLIRRQVSELEALQAVSHQRCVVVSRRIAQMIEFMLDKKVFHTSGSVLRNIVNVVTFLAHAPTQDGDQGTSSATGSLQDDQVAVDVIDPRSLFTDPAAQPSSSAVSSSGSAYSRSRRSSTSDEGHVPHRILTGQLPAFDTLRKHHEVQVCLEAMAQMGYAWPSVDKEIDAVERMFHLAIQNQTQQH